MPYIEDMLGIPLYFIALIPMILFNLFLLGYCFDEEYWDTEEKNNHHEHRDRRDFRRSSGAGSTNIFAGLSVSEAKKKYRELLKQYHPYNVAAGDEAMAKRIIEDYQRYQKAHS